jgi:hypothetical protein
MTSNFRYVIDTGVIVSALLQPKSIPRQSFDLAFDLGQVMASEATLNELSQVLRRTKFDRYLTMQERLQFLATFARDVTITDVKLTFNDCRDPKDNKFLELAISSNTTCIISGDNDLLILHPFRGVKILTPQLFLKQ